MKHLEYFQQQLDDLKQQGQYRQFKQGISSQPYLQLNGIEMLNLASNDYLGLAANLQLREEFFDLTPLAERQMSASSSRLLTGNFPAYEQLETSMAQVFGRSVLLFNSGYHMNIGILPALADSKTIIIADKLVHASIIDGIRLSNASYVRYRHNDLEHLQQLLVKYQADDNIQRIIVVTESIFSMDGDETDLGALVALKQQFDKVMLYVDEAHAIGVRGEHGLGCAEEYQVIDQIDLLVGTFGKALASVGGYLVCHPLIREYLINSMRPLIFSTAQPPICMAWTHFIFQKMQAMREERQQLGSLARCCHQSIQALGYACPSSSQIVPVIIGDAAKTVAAAEYVQQKGFYVLPVRPPTVPKNTSRLRICLHQQVSPVQLQQLLDALQELPR
ncbi:8-amino-7-oxononanoate synthase [Acinetobacter sp. CIP 101934]|uniref:8-amino-7-oxononanoate synthase n=1 Tax=Acinetobacter schindleri TaxID=108981 RepID=A0AAE2MW20_9GAMM|nr:MULTISPECIES: 8-amino-7-oxononanoate synthase [Acinetobacter]EIM39044.1 8-amino-7-oxononanoate synthase [Acinetobacter sp. HA]ENX02474.1 8-amino-7-oxononanoate synthase [Acinetobacter sp. CIP 101934]MBB4835575.1 8-amino-7-oxononanoate synthase [Acinetobacter schindleri]MDP1443805.1 8-amino-7-oxononanoate synthase [Acinetobacter schindleri]QIC67920.1 8-amino-7-oxononanoate synthase [Acinetobacter schindleri]